jgi:hypothetical protein
MSSVVMDIGALAALVHPDKLTAEGFLRPERVLVIPGTDHSGEEAFHVYAVYANDTPDEALAWNKVKTMVRWMRNKIRKASGEVRFPYVRVVREADLPPGLS